MMKSYSVKMQCEKFNCFFVDLLRYRFGRIKVTSNVVERKNTLDTTFV